MGLFYWPNFKFRLMKLSNNGNAVVWQFHKPMSFHIVMFIPLLLPYLCCLWPAGGKSKVPLQYFGPSGNALRSGNIQAMQLFLSATRSQLLDCIALAFSTRFRFALTIAKSLRTGQELLEMEQRGEFSMKSITLWLKSQDYTCPKLNGYSGPDFPHWYLVF